MLCFKKNIFCKIFCRNGFNIPELIIVLAIVLGLGGVVALNTMNEAKKTEYQSLMNDIQLLEGAESNYIANNNMYCFFSANVNDSQDYRVIEFLDLFNNPENYLDSSNEEERSVINRLKNFDVENKLKEINIIGLKSNAYLKDLSNKDEIYFIDIDTGSVFSTGILSFPDELLNFFNNIGTNGGVLIPNVSLDVEIIDTITGSVKKMKHIYDSVTFGNITICVGSGDLKIAMVQLIPSVIITDLSDKIDGLDVEEIYKIRKDLDKFQIEYKDSYGNVKFCNIEI